MDFSLPEEVENYRNKIREFVQENILPLENDQSNFDENNNMKGAPVDVSLDMSLVKHEFNKNDYIPLKVGLARTIEWQKSLYNFS